MNANDFRSSCSFLVYQFKYTVLSIFFQIQQNITNFTFSKELLIMVQTCSPDVPNISAKNVSFPEIHIMQQNKTKIFASDPWRAARVQILRLEIVNSPLNRETIDFNPKQNKTTFPGKSAFSSTNLKPARQQPPRFSVQNFYGVFFSCFPEKACLENNFTFYLRWKRKLMAQNSSSNSALPVSIVYLQRRVTRKNNQNYYGLPRRVFCGEVCPIWISSRERCALITEICTFIGFE